MAEQSGHETRSYGEMDYPEHRRTYGRFLDFVKYGTVAVVTLLIFLCVYLIAKGGFIAGVVAAGAFAAVAVFMLRTGDEHSMKH